MLTSQTEFSPPHNIRSSNFQKALLPSKKTLNLNGPIKKNSQYSLKPQQKLIFGSMNPNVTQKSQQND